MPERTDPIRDPDQLLERLRAAERDRDTAVKRCRRLMMALAVVVLLLVAVVGSGVWWLRQHILNEEAERTRRQAAVQRDVEEALRQADGLRSQARWEDALAAVEKAAALLGDDGPEELRDRVKKLREDLAQVARDQVMVQRLTDIRIPVAGGQDDREEEAAQRFRQAFRDWGLDPEKEPPEEVSKRIRTSPIGPVLTAALDDWARVQRDGAVAERLRSLAGLTDSDPWRRQVRNALAGKDREAVQRLAKAEEVARQPASTSILLADALHRVGLDEQRVNVLRSALLRHPNAFSLYCELAGAYSTLKPPRHDEAAGYYRAALALQPDSVAALYGLAAALHKQDRLDEAIACYRRALALDPKLTAAQANLDRALKGEGPKE
jgi:tetratricopeptide (TPR) repeat protein